MLGENPGSVFSELSLFIFIKLIKDLCKKNIIYTSKMVEMASKRHTAYTDIIWAHADCIFKTLRSV